MGLVVGPGAGYHARTDGAVFTVLILAGLQDRYETKTGSLFGI